MARFTTLCAVILVCGCASRPQFEQVQVVEPAESALPEKSREAMAERLRPWDADGTLEALPDSLKANVRERARRSAELLETLDDRNADLVGGTQRLVVPAPKPGNRRQDKAEAAAAEESREEHRDQYVFRFGGRGDESRALDCATGDNEALVRCARLVHRENSVALRRLERDLLFVHALAPYSAQLITLYDATVAAIDASGESAKVASARSSQYGFFAGPNYSLGGDGNWKTGFEFMGRFNTEAFRRAMPEWCALCWYRGYSEVSYQRVNALEDPESVAPGSGSLPVSSPAALQEELDNPFLTIGGYLRVNLGVQVHWTDWSGMQLGGGYSSLPNDDGITHMRPRGFIGPHFETLFPDGAYGSVFAGFAYDEFWEREVFRDPNDPSQGTEIRQDFDRFNVDLLFIFPPEALGTRAVGRLFIDTPLDGEGPSDVRASILLYYSLSDWMQLFAPVREVSAKLPVLAPSLPLVR